MSADLDACDDGGVAAGLDLSEFDDPETQELRPLFPAGDPGGEDPTAEEWAEVFG